MWGFVPTALHVSFGIENLELGIRNWELEIGVWKMCEWGH